MEIGVAMCLGPYAMGIRLPKPFRDIAGNCIVISVPIPFPCGNKKVSTTKTEQYLPFMDEKTDTNIEKNSCNSNIGPEAIK
jgi:hypothetical protein